MTSASSSLTSDVPIELPLYGATFRTAVVRFWKKYATFSGRASRSEYWWAVAFLAFTGGVIDVVASVSLISTSFARPSESQTVALSPLLIVAFALVGLWGLAFVIPTYAVTVRRLHDTNRSGFFIFMGLIPYAGAIIVLVFTLSNSNPLGQRFDSTDLESVGSSG